MPFSFGLHSSLSRVEEGWLKVPPKRKFRNSKTSDEKNNSGKNLIQNQHNI